MTALAAIVTHTPIWVFSVFALLLLLGVQGLRPRRVALARLLVTPAVFVSWGLVSLALAARVTATAPLAWAVTATAGFALAYATVRLHGLGAEPGGRVHLPGSAQPLTRNMLIFSTKYVLAATMAVDPEARSQLVLWDIAVSGASAGYFVGWTVRLFLAYRRAAQPLPVRGRCRDEMLLYRQEML